MKKITLFFLSFIFLSFLNAQNDYNKLWENLLKNDRDAALKTFGKIKNNNTLEYLITKEILRVENGKFTENKEFTPAFIQQNDFEYYLYALWNEPYIFSDYLTTGFNDRNRKNVSLVSSKAKFKTTALKDAFNYLNAIVARDLNNFDAYHENIAKLKTLNKWQFCGVFENLNKSGLNRYYEPEGKPQSTTPFNAESNGYVNWYKPKASKDGYEFFGNHVEYGGGVNYAQTFITAAKNEEVILRIGCGSAFKIWLNDVLVMENNEDVITELNAYNVKLTIPKGVNRLLLKTSESGYDSYFIISALNVDGTHNTTLKCSADYKAYNKSSEKSINASILRNEFETYFEEKVKQNPDNFLYAYCLYSTYLRNSRYKEAKAVLEPYSKKYPKSSLIKKLLIDAYYIEGDTASIKEIKENIELDDSDYYFPLVMKTIDFSELNRMTLTELEAFLKKLKTKIDNDIIHVTVDFILNARKEDKAKVKNNLDKLIKLAKNDSRLTLKYAPLHAKLFQDDDKTISLLEGSLKTNYNYSTVLGLASYYDKKNKKKDVIKLLKKDLEHFNRDNFYLADYVDQLHTYNMYKESLEYIDLALENFPYSFAFMELKGDALLQLNKKKEAVNWYEKSLSHNSSNSTLRKKIRDLKGEKNLINDSVLDDAYKFIENNRNKITKNNYGYNILYDTSIVELYNEGGGNTRYAFIYEITSDNGVERFKEYNLGLRGNYHIIKSEVVKKNKSVIPADKSGSSFVFNGLAIGDVIYIEYEASFSKSGRFYKSFTDSYMLGSFHPNVESSVKIIVPNEIDINYVNVNGKTQPKKTKKGNHTIYEWVRVNNNGLEQVENYMPKDVDVAEFIHVSTIKDWHEISLWYSDLVKSTMKKSAVVDKVFNDLFPKGYKSLSENERAKIIYNYIKNNFNYSHVSFRQSGFIPQKPSKTINSGLGDCKDFSTLFVTLAKKAELDANLVLILTSDYGDNTLVLPSTDFNHCIAKVMINGKPQFLELTDKYLPYKSLPKSLRGATGLEIPLDRNDAGKVNKLFKLKNASRDKAVSTNNITLNIEDNIIKMKVASEYKGHINSYYSSTLSDPNYEVIKTDIFDNYSNKIKDDFTLDTIHNIKHIDNDKIIKYTADFTIKKKFNKIGSIYVLQVPKISRPYTKGIIDYEKRNYDIVYKKYENVDEYNVNYDVKLNKNQKFTEIPENLKLSFKGHSYSVTYKLVKPNHLQISIKAVPSLDIIKPEDYQEFKNYVIKILDSEKEFIGFKKV